MDEDLSVVNVEAIFIASITTTESPRIIEVNLHTLGITR